MATIVQQGCVDVIQLDERLTVDEAESVRVLVDTAMRNKLPQIVVDMRRLRLLDSAGLELLCESRESCVRRGGMLRLAGASSLVVDIFRITGLGGEFPSHDTIASAAGAFAL